MAKSKKGPALFEVIRAAQQKQLEQQRKAEQRQARDSARETAHADAAPGGGTLKQAAAALKSHGFWLGGRAPQPAVAEVAAPVARPAADNATHKPFFRTVPLPDPVALPPSVPLGRPSAEIELAPAREPDARSWDRAHDLSRASGDTRDDGLQGGAHDDANDIADGVLEDTPSAFDHPAVSYAPAEDDAPRDHLSGGTAAEPVFREVVADEAHPAPEFAASGHAAEVESYARAATPPADEIIEQPQIEAPRPAPVSYAAPAAAPLLGPRSDPAAEAMRRVREEIAASASSPQASPAASRDDGSDTLNDFFRGNPRDPAASDGRGPSWVGRLPLRFNYATGIAAGLGLVVLGGVVLSVLLSGNQPQAAAAKRPDVLDLKPPTAVASATDAPDTARARPDTAGKVGVVAPKPITPPGSVNRVKGRQYLVLISARSEDAPKKMVKFLAEKGIAATVENGLPEYSKWYTVVTERGFDRTKNNPDFAAFEAELTALMPKFNLAGSKQAAGKPVLYKWR
jgi:hypothetical protein